MMGLLVAPVIPLGVKLLDPSVFSSAEFTHCATRQLQALLLKICLLLGVFVRVGCHISRLDERFKTTLRRLARGAATHDAAYEDGLPCDLLVDATGARCRLFQDMGFQQVTMLRGARALVGASAVAIGSQLTGRSHVGACRCTASLGGGRLRGRVCAARRRSPA